jgi:hypothetical protein
VINLGERQQPAGEGCILGLLGRYAKLRASEVSANGDRGGHGESPSFVMVNHTAADLKTPRESVSRRRGMRSHIGCPLHMKVGCSSTDRLLRPNRFVMFTPELGNSWLKALPRVAR